MHDFPTWAVYTTEFLSSATKDRRESYRELARRLSWQRWQSHFILRCCLCLELAETCSLEIERDVRRTNEFGAASNTGFDPVHAPRRHEREEHQPAQ